MLLAAVARAAGAQVAPPPVVPPPSAAAQAAPTREEVTRPDLAPAPPAPSRLTVEGGVQRAPCALADARFADVKITLAGALFAHLRGVSPDLLRPAYADLIGKTVPIAAVCEIRDAAATILRDAGYLAAVQVPPQTIEKGVVYFDVLMPRLVAVQVRGHPGKSAELIAAYMRKLTGREVFNEHEAERYLLLAKDLPGYDVRLTLRPAGDGVPGDVIGELSVLRQPLAVDFNVQDYGSRSVGRFGGLLRGEFYDVLGHGDRLSLGVFSTGDFAEQQVVQAGYDVRIGPEGLTIGGNFTYAWTHPSIPKLDVRSRTLVAGINARYPIVRSQAADFAATVGLDFIDQNVRFAGLPLTRDHVRTAYLRFDGDTTDKHSVKGESGYSAAEPRWRLGGTIEVRQGVDILDATDPCLPRGQRCNGPGAPPSSRADGRPHAIVWRVSGVGEWRPVPMIAFVLTPSAQYAHAPTLNYDQYSAGTYTVGRGYDAGTVQGDSGVGVASEVRYGSLVPRGGTALAVQPYAFLDAAWVWTDSSSFAVGGHDRLLSAGGGVRAAWGSHARLDLAVAVPLDHAGTLDRRGDTRVLLSLTTRLLPWR